MAKPDWSELQKQFLSDHAKSGISPKEWCEDQGLNYATARRYIKKPAAQSAQKTAQKSQYTIVIYQLRRVVNKIMRTMMKTRLNCATASLQTYNFVSSMSILST